MSDATMSDAAPAAPSAAEATDVPKPRAWWVAPNNMSSGQHLVKKCDLGCDHITNDVVVIRESAYRQMQAPITGISLGDLAIYIAVAGIALACFMANAIWFRGTLAGIATIMGIGWAVFWIVDQERTSRSRHQTAHLKMLELLKEEEHLAAGSHYALLPEDPHTSLPAHNARTVFLMYAQQPSAAPPTT